MDLPGLEGVIGETAQQLVRSFGQPRLDPTATHLEARRASDGFEVDRVACANALKGR